MNDLFDFDLTDTGIAAEQAVRRWQNYTGQVAVHAITGEPFPG
jgi:hypothetical protein